MPAVERLQPTGLRRLAVDEREIRLLHAPRLERTLERLKGSVVLGDDEAAGRLLVEPMDDARAEHAAHTGQPLDVVEERVHEGPPCVTRCRMHDETRGLVEDEEVPVLVQDGQWEILGLGDRRLGRWDGDLERLASLETERRAPGPSIDEDASRFEKRLDARPAELGQAGRNGLVEPVAPERGTDRDPMNHPALPVAL